jgi:hypothetical protein
MSGFNPSNSSDSDAMNVTEPYFDYNITYDGREFVPRSIRQQRYQRRLREGDWRGMHEYVHRQNFDRDGAGPYSTRGTSRSGWGTFISPSQDDALRTYVAQTDREQLYGPGIYQRQRERYRNMMLRDGPGGFRRHYFNTHMRWRRAEQRRVWAAMPGNWHVKE